MTEFLKKITSKDIRNIIAILIVFGCFILVYLFMIKEIPQPNRDLVMVVAGAIVGNLKDVTSYFFGASKTESDRVKKEAE
jgi:predicted permease